MAGNFDLLEKVKVLTFGSLKQTPPKSNLSSSIIISGCTIFACTLSNKVFPPLINIGISAVKLGFGVEYVKINSIDFGLSVKYPAISLN